MLTLFSLVLVLQAAPLDDNLAFQEGRRLSEQFEYEKAIFRFREALRDESLGHDRATVLVWLGLTYAKVGEQGAADDAFLEAVRIDPLVALPPSTPPKIHEALESARRRLRVERATAAATSPGTTATGAPTNPPPAGAPGGSTTTGGTASAAPMTTATTTTTTTASPTATAPAPATTVPAEPPAGGSGTSLVIGGGVLVGLGVLGLGAGVGLGALAASTADEAHAALFQDDRQRLNEEAAQQSLGANLGYGVGGAVAIAGLVVLTLGLVGGAP
jgi:hypothetical protein